MLRKLPTQSQIPPLAILLDDIGAPSADELAGALGVTARTVRRWQLDGHAPLPVQLALYPLTRWGMHHAHAEAHREAQLAIGLANSLADANKRLERELRRLQALNRTGAANQPSLQRMPLLWAVEA